jgi:L-malate glycosyltransferase
VCVVGSDSGGPLEIIDDTINGYLFDPKDPDGLHNLLYMLFKNPIIRKEVALEGKCKAISSFNFEKHCQALKSALLKG